MKESLIDDLYTYVIFSSVEAVNLESWPTTSESSSVAPSRPSKSGKYINQIPTSSSSESIPSLFEFEEVEITKKRKGLLPPISGVIEQSVLPGGIFMTPQIGT